MSALLGLVAILVAAAAIASHLRDRYDAESRPGASSANPIAIAHFDEINAVVALRRCPCRGRFRLRGEGPVGSDGRIRQVRSECNECGREEVLFFDLAEAHRQIHNP